MNFTVEGVNILKELATDERMINYNNQFFKADNPGVKSNFFKRCGTLLDFFIDLLNGKISTFRAAKEQEEMLIKIVELKDFLLLEKSNLKKSKKKTKKI